MNLTGDQQYFMDILRETGFVRMDQVLPLLRVYDPSKRPNQAEAMLRRLRYLGLLTSSAENLVSLPELRDTAPNRETLLAVDILLALAPAKLLQISIQPPYRLCFLLQRADGWIDYFAVMPVQPGHEARISQLLQAERKQYVFLLPLEDGAQHRKVMLNRSHFFILRQGGSLRFYKGGEAGK